MNRLIMIILVALSMGSCNKNYEAPVPDYSGWDEFNNANTDSSLNMATRNAMEGVYTLGKANDDFGGLTALKWSYTRDGDDTSFHL